MKRFSANYSNSNHNFVIQNLPGGLAREEYVAAIAIVKNILQRGCPTLMSQFLQSKLGNVVSSKPFALISSEPPKWQRVIRGSTKQNYNPAQKFFDVLIPKYFPDFPFFQQLLLPEVPINTITQIEVDEFVGRQVDFYLQQAFLVIEIDGSGHDALNDQKRDKHLERFGVKTIRITTQEVEAENSSFKAKVNLIRQHISQALFGQQNSKYVSLTNYLNTLRQPSNISSNEHIATAVMRFQILVLELLQSGNLNFTENWTFNLLCKEQNGFEELACEDLLLWFENIFRLQRISFKKPKITINRVPSFDELKRKEGSIKIDFSITKRYTDEFQNNEDIIFVRTDYLDYYIYYKNANAVTPEYIGLKPYDYFQIATANLFNYRIQIKGEWEPEKALCFFLENIFGYKNFFAGQLPIIISALERKDTVGLLPTGGGKSVCYQLAVLLQPAISFVVCPIKSLMYDQRQDLQKIHVTRVNHITSDNDGEDKERIMKEFAEGKYFFLFISPERFQLKTFREYLLAVNQNHKLAYAVIDEVHCLSEWGHDFRTSYLNLSQAIQKHCTDFRFIGLTATASINVLKDIQIEFGIKDENVKTLADYTREELEFEVINDNDDKLSILKNFISSLHDGGDVLKPSGEGSKCGIIFTPTVNGTKGCYQLSIELEQHFRAPVRFYSGQIPVVNNQGVMNTKEFEGYKRKAQDDFKQNNFTLLTATKAFGMGVNKGNIHYTVHYGIPSSMEALYQEAGRAGRDKQKFKKKKANCIVLFTKTENEQLLELVWHRDTPLSRLNEIRQQTTGDINTNLFLFTSGLDIIRNEFEVIKTVLTNFAKPGRAEVVVTASRAGTDKFRAEKAIYRLSQLGIVEDWTVSNFFTGQFEVDFSNYTEASIIESLKRTINKYDKEFSFEALATSDKYKNYNDTWNKTAPLIDKCIVILLQWAYEHFVYNRRQSLKNIYEGCSKYVDGELNKEEFKTLLENYFKFSEVSYVLQHVAEHPLDYKKWFQIFYQEGKKEIINWEQRQALMANLSRFLESYQYNTGLDFISGMIRLLVDDFDNADGKNRFSSAWKEITKLENKTIDFILKKTLEVGATMSSKSKRQLAYTLLQFFPNDKQLLKKIHEAIGDEYTAELLLVEIKTRLTKLNKTIYGKLIEIR